MAANSRSYTGGRFAFSIGTDAPAVVSKVEPGAMEFDVADIAYSTSNIIGKQTTNMKWGEWKVSVGIGMSQQLYSLINAAMDQEAAPFSGQIAIADFNYLEQRVITFYDALITSVSMPKFAAKEGKSAFTIDIGFIPERVEYSPGSGADIRGKLGPAQKAFSTNNYRVTIGDLPCRRVTEVDALKWTVKTALEYSGELALPTIHCAKVERPELTVTLSAADAQPFEQHCHSFMMGKRLVTDEMSGSIELLDPTLGKPVATINLKQMGWKKFAADAYEANKEGTSQVKATFWVEDSDLIIHEYDA
jgi:hypothetical protein